MTAADTPLPLQPDFLIRGSDYLAANPSFQVIGRKDEMNAITDVLLRKGNSNNLVIHGKNGVGLSTLVLGLEAAKQKPGTPFELASKNLYFLDTDALFAASNPDEITERFQKAMETLEASDNAVLVIDDTKGFLDGVNNTGAHNVVNILMRAVRTDSSLQAIFEADERDVPDLLKAHADIQKNFSLLDIDEPSKDDLRPIIENVAKNIGDAYGVEVSKQAVDSVMELTEKYPGLSLGVAQPKRSQLILEGAMTAYIRTAHAKPAGAAELEETIAAIDAGTPGRDLADKTPDELAAIRLEAQSSLDELTGQWSAQQEELQAILRDESETIRALGQINAEFDQQRAIDADKRAMHDDFNDASSPEVKARLKKEYKEKYNDVLVEEDAASRNFDDLAAMGLSKEASELDQTRKQYKAALKEIAARKEELKATFGGGNDGLKLSDNHVLAEFSRLSGVPANKLQQDEKQKLLHLSDTMKKRVFGQEEPIEALAEAVQRAKTGLKKPKKPIGSFIFLGPSGVGKTELAKALAEALFGDESALQIYNMSEYMDKSAANTLIGAPAGLVGYEEGGVLTNNMRARPYCVNVFDEAEKAHKDIFDLFLQIVDEGELRDRRGMLASFANSINILTSNIGAKHFLDESITFEEAKERALADLWNPNGDPNDPRQEEGTVRGFRPEFLNRFTGIFCFNRLGQVEILHIADKNLQQLNDWIAEKGLSIDMAEADKKAMCEEQYDPKNGGRGIATYIENTITTAVARTLLGQDDATGVVKVSYDKKADAKNKIKTTLVPQEEATPAAEKKAEKKTAAPKP